MADTWQVRHEGERILLGIGVDRAVLDISSDAKLLVGCLELLNSPRIGLVDIQMGWFGAYPVTLNLGAHDDVSIFVDGPDFADRSLSAAIWVDEAWLKRVLSEALQGS